MIKHVWDVKYSANAFEGISAKVYLVPGWLIFNNAAMVIKQNVILLNKDVYKVRGYDVYPQQARALMAHELAHCVQFRDNKWFIARYLWDSLLKLLSAQHPYRDNRFEVQARSFETLQVEIEPLHK